MSTNIVRGGIVAAICGAAIFVGAATPAPAFTLSSSSSSSLKQSGASSHIEHVYYYRRAYGYRGGYGYRGYGFHGGYGYGYGARCWINPYGVRVCRW